MDEEESETEMIEEDEKKMVDEDDELKETDDFQEFLTSLKVET